MTECKTFENFILDIIREEEFDSNNYIKKQKEVSTNISNNVDNHIQNPKQSENISTKADSTNNSTDNKIVQNNELSVIENKNSKESNTSQISNSQNNAEDKFKNYYVLVESYEKELQKDGKPTKYQFATFVDQYNKTVDAVISPKFIKELIQCDTGTTVILDLKTAGKLTIANDIKFVQKCPKNVAA